MLVCIERPTDSVKDDSLYFLGLRINLSQPLRQASKAAHNVLASKKDSIHMYDMCSFYCGSMLFY